jgi:hypothetical protein
MKRRLLVATCCLGGFAGIVVLSESLKDNWEVIHLDGPKPYLLLTKVAPRIEVSRDGEKLLVGVVRGKPWVPVSWELTKDTIKASSTTEKDGAEITVYDDDADGIPDRRLTISADHKTVTVEKLKSIEWEVTKKSTREK